MQLPHSFLIPWQEQKTTTQNCEMETQTSEEKFRIANLELELCGEKTSELWNKKIAVTFFQFLIPWRKTELREVRILWEKVSILSLHLPILTFFPLIVRKSRNYLLLIIFFFNLLAESSFHTKCKDNLHCCHITLQHHLECKELISVVCFFFLTKNWIKT